ncbi:MAG: TIM44-like domain-containing protein, partial [Kiritimatiellaeota bacterium]|nr:TIM44-like domain-containing protein [Kiritimatiellota bacterium]
LALLGLLGSATEVFARGGGGCLEAGTGILTPVGEIPIEQLQRGDAVIGLRAGQRIHTTVADVFVVRPAEFIEITQRGRLLHLTPEHPVAVGMGEFLAAEKIPGARRVAATKPAFNLLVAEGGVYFANGVLVHNKGCFLPDTTILRADGTSVQLGAVRPGDQIKAFDSANRLVTATVAEVITHAVDEYVALTTERASVRVTLEHPFYVGDGRFKTVETLRVGDEVFLCDGAGLQAQRIIGLTRVHEPVRVFNLRTDAPHTFFANAFAVHNKGGGCFPAGTRIATPAGATPIEQLVPGCAVLGVDAAGVCVTSSVRRLYQKYDRLLTLYTDRGELRTTAEHPLRLFTGGFRPAAAVEPGAALMVYKSGLILSALVSAKVSAPVDSVVFNLEVEVPHTFIAEGFVVHNKGGGGGHSGGFHSSSHAGSGSGDDNPWHVFILLGFVILIVSGCIAANKEKREDEDLDFVYAPGRVAAKAGKTRKLLEFLARQDAAMQPEKLEATARATFLTLQECWQNREYGPMQVLLMPDLYLNHCGQLAGLKRNHEINMISGVKMERVEIVNVRYMHKPDQGEFTALITASAKDFYVDDRTLAFLRGDKEPAEFQEFWTFHRQGDGWLLREIEQSRESAALKQENFAEQFTEAQLRQVYGGKADEAGPAGPWLGKDVETKATKIERMLNFLSHKLSEESGDMATVCAELFPEVAAHLAQQLAEQKQRGLSPEYRNLCVRKVELILVRNYADNTKDEFTARISAHAQQFVRRTDGTEVARDDYVTPFVEFWTFGRLDNYWKLKEVLPTSKGERELSVENVDEDSSAAQLRWYYTKNRAT